MSNIEQYITKHSLIQHSDIIIIGLSGGPDSIFLLYTLKALQAKYNLTLIAAHLNHEWRDEAHHDEQLSRTAAQNLNIPFVSEKLSHLSAAIKPNGSKEEVARKFRRFFLEQVAQKHNASSIALGHHAQDQQETFFIRLIRGTSLSGLACMRAKSGTYIRPLLKINKQNIVQWLNENSIPYAQDITNVSTDYLRNRIRLNVIPALTACDTRWDANFMETLDRIQAENQLLDDIAQSTLNSLLDQKETKLVLNTKKLALINTALQHRIIIEWFIRNGIPFSPTQSFLDEALRFLCTPQGGVHTIHPNWSIVKKHGQAFISQS